MNLKTQYVQLDVFTGRAFGGNQLAVFLDTDNWTVAQMQAVTREMNFSECTFLQTPTVPGADFRVRIFTPARELPMAGHPVIGTIFALFELGLIKTQPGLNRLVFQLGIGPTELSLLVNAAGELEKAFMTQLLPAFQPVTVSLPALASALGVDTLDLGDARLSFEVGSAGVPFLFVPFKSLAAIGRIAPDLNAIRQILQATGAGGLYAVTLETQTPGANSHGRMFAPDMGLVEDAATGGASGPLGVYLWRHTLQKPDDSGTIRLLLEQGYEMGRPSQIEVELEVNQGHVKNVQVGGKAVMVARGEFFFNYSGDIS